MIAYIIIIIITSIIVSIITEQMLVRRLQISEGIIINKGQCRLREGYGKLNAPVPEPAYVLTPDVCNRCKQYSDQVDQNTLDLFFKPLK
jgi:hypothetical protein